MSPRRCVGVICLALFALGYLGLVIKAIRDWFRGDDEAVPFLLTTAAFTFLGLMYWGLSGE